MERRKRRLAVMLAPCLLALGLVAAFLSSGPQPSTGGFRRKALSPATLAAPATWLYPYEYVDWLHIPKAGTSFGNTLVLWACPELPPQAWVGKEGAPDLPADCAARFRGGTDGSFPWGGVGAHRSLTNYTDAELASVFALIRSPRTRLASAFHFFTNYTRPHATEERICRVAAGYSELHGFSSFGSQVKMIVGEPTDVWQPKRFLSTAPATKSQLEEACRRLRLFSFVGLTDQWNASVCLFHGMFTGRTPHAVEFENVRAGRYGEQSVRQVDCRDSIDDGLFNCASELFHERLEQHPQCRVHLVPGGLGGQPLPRRAAPPLPPAR